MAQIADFAFFTIEIEGGIVVIFLRPSIILFPFRGSHIKQRDGRHFFHDAVLDTQQMVIHPALELVVDIDTIIAECGRMAARMEDRLPRDVILFAHLYHQSAVFEFHIPVAQAMGDEDGAVDVRTIFRHVTGIPEFAVIAGSPVFN